MYSLKREKGKKAMNLTYQSTRGGESGLTASQAILKGLADDGGLFMPTSIPKLDVTMEELAGMTYQETAYRVMKQFLTDFTEEELRYCIDHAYDSKFDTEIVSLLSFKDQRLQGHGTVHSSVSDDYLCKEESCGE